MTTLAGKIALVTGAGSGIGASIAERFAAAGAHVIVTDVDAQAASDVTARLAAAGGLSEALPLDVTREDSAGGVAEAVHRRHGRLDVLVNNAGVGHVGTILQAAGTDLDRLY